MRLDVKASRELLATIYAIRSLDKTLQKVIRQQTQRIAAPEWRKALAERAHTRLQQRVLVDTSVVTVSNQNIRIRSASKGRPLSGGFNPKTNYHAAEFGADRNAKVTYDGFRGHKRFPVTRHTRRQLPARNREGLVFYPAARDMVARLGSLLVQTTYRTIANALEGKQG